MILYSKLFGLILNLIVVGAVFLALTNMQSMKGKVILLSAAVLLFALPLFIQAAPPDWKWLTLYLSKVGLGLFCLIHVRLKKS